jgi:hypothetical protein
MREKTMKFVSGVLGALCLLSLLAALGAATFWHSPAAFTGVNLRWPIYVEIGLLFGLLSVVFHRASQRPKSD